MNDSTDSRGSRSRWPWIIGFALTLLLFILLLFQPGGESTRTGHPSVTYAPPPGTHDTRAADPRSRSKAGSGIQTAEEIVTAKVRQYAQSRRAYARALARRAGKPVSDEVEAFFDALERGNWQEIEERFKNFSQRSGQYEGSTNDPGINEVWPAILDAYGAAEQAHDWPAQKLLDYGNAILDSLQPGMVYIGGTDPGRWIPSLLNDTSDGERHIVITQNALADKRYLDYVEFLYSDRMTTLSQADSDRAFADYIADARRRWEHDQQFPDEPKQLRPGEVVGMKDGKFQVSGQVSVMDINERLFRMIMEKNPEFAFAMEESFPFASVLANGSPLGPIMEVNTGNNQNPITPERATQTVDYWQNTTAQLLRDPEAESAEVRKTYSKLLSSQGGLFLAQDHPQQAETLFRLAAEVCPYSPEAVFRYANLLVDQQRAGEALPIVQNALRAEPNNQQFLNLQSELNRRLSSQQPAPQ